MEGFNHPLAGRHAAGRGRGADRAAQRRPAGQRDPAPAAGARPPRRRASDRADPRRQGRRRPDGGQRRAAGAGPRGAAAVHAERRDAAADGGGRDRRGRRGGRRRPLEPVRQADGPAAARGQRHRDVCHSRTRDLGEVCRRADILIAAVGRAEMVGGDWVKPGATVIDVGINRTEDGLVGDVDFAAAAEVAGAITPVPGRRGADDHRLPAAQHAAGRADAACRVAFGPWANRLRFAEKVAGGSALALFGVLVPRLVTARADLGAGRRGVDRLRARGSASRAGSRWAGSPSASAA